MKKSVFWVLVGAISLSACKEAPKREYKPESIGAINSVSVIMDTDLWEGRVGDKIREHFAAPMEGLPWDEAKFTLTQMPEQVFSGATKNTRAVLFVKKDSIERAHIKTDLYAAPQKIGVIKSTTADGLIAYIDSVAPRLVKAFKDQEILAAQNRFRKSLNKESALQKKFGISLNIPSAYRVGREADNFVWIDRQIRKGHMNIIAYTMPGESFGTDSTFVKDIIRMRDSIGELYIPGPDSPDKVTYMITEKAFAPYVFPAELDGHKAAEVRGIWEVKNYPMAGPFITYIINDPENDRKVVLEGFTFAPSTEKRDYMFQLEAIMKSIRFLETPVKE
jgi:hypothetical protein